MPDIPRLVETRSMLLAGDCRVFGRVDEGHVVIVHGGGTLASVIGRPTRREIGGAVATLRGELLADERTAPHVAAALPGWRGQGAAIHTRPGATRFPPAALPTRALQESDPLDHLTPALRGEIEDARARTTVAVACADGLPVAFCYAGSETETLWDVSVDTVDAYRGRGFASAAFLRLAALLAEKGKAPVWGALDSNHASLRLAARLGFVAVDRLAVFSRLDAETLAPRT